MSEPTKLQRPRQVTLASFLIMGGSVLVVATVFEQVAGINNLETQEAVETFLAQPPGDGLGLDVPGALVVLRTVSMVAAGCASVAGILGFHVLKRNRSARLGLTILAVPLFLSGLVVGGFLSSVVAASAVMLWMGPARDWFNGIEPRRRPDPEPGTPAVPPPPAGPREQTGFGAATAATAATRAYDAPAQPAGPRPDSVVWACVLTWSFSGLAAVVMGVSDHTVEIATYVTAGATTVWALVAIVLAVLVYRRTAWARVALIGSTAGAAAVCVLASLGSLLMLLPLIGCAATFSLLLRPDVRAWFAGP